MFVIAEELNPLIRIYAWRMMLGREGVMNSVAAGDRADRQADRLAVVHSTAVVIVLSTTYISYTTIPIYAALKAVDPDLLEAAERPRRAFCHACRKILLPLAAPGIFVAIILVYIPMFSEFAAPALVGGTAVHDRQRDPGSDARKPGTGASGSAMSFMLLVLSGAVAWSATGGEDPSTAGDA